jgi:putative peptidoglycan lipid II flippase
MLWFSLGIFAWGAQGILARGYYAMRNTMTPTLVGTIFTAAVLPLSYVLMQSMQHEGLALASSIGIIAYAVTLYALFHRKMSRVGARTDAAIFCEDGARLDARRCRGVGNAPRDR